MVTRKLFFLFTMFYLALFFSNLNHGISAKAAGYVPPLSPPSEPGDTPLYQSIPASRCSVASCAGACTLDTYVWGNAYTFDITYMDAIPTYFDCDTGKLAAAFEAVFHEAESLAAIETGGILGCGGLWGGWEYDCAHDTNACANDPCSYAPDLLVSLNPDPGAEKAAVISLDNTTVSYGVHEYLPTSAITGGITLTTTIKYNVNAWDEAIPIAIYDLPSLGYPGLGWAAALAARCTDNKDHRCDILNSLAAGQLTKDISVPLPQGGVYNLKNLVSSSAGVSDSDLRSGVAKLIQGGDSVTMIPGLSGITFVREDHGWDGPWDKYNVETWNSLAGPITISNSECHYLCWLSGKQSVNRDKFVIVLDGPCDQLLLGSYTVRAEAPLDHDQNISNNSAEQGYWLNSIPSGCGEALDSASVEATLLQGSHDFSFDNEFIKYYQVHVTEDASLLEIVLTGPNSSDPNDNLDLLLRHGSVPETTRQGFVAYDYVAQDDVGYQDKLRVQIPEAGEWYIEVYHSGLLYTNDFQLKVNVETSATPIIDLNEGQYTFNLTRGHTSQVFRVPYHSYMNSMQISYTPPKTLWLWADTDYKIYMCPQETPVINYDHLVFPGFVCNTGGQVAFAGFGGLTTPWVASTTSPGSQAYYLLVERTSGAASKDYKLDIDFTWPATSGLEVENNGTANNDGCATADPWHAQFTIPKRGFFYRPGSADIQDAYTFTLGNATGGSVEMETYLASVPAGIMPGLIVSKKVGTTWEDSEEIAADRTAAKGGSPSVRFDLVYGQEYCIQVESMNQAQNQTDPYSLYIRYAGLAGTDETEVEPNNYPDDWGEQASPWVNMDNAMRGRWSPLADRDYFKWTAPATGIYFVAVSATPTIPTHTLMVFEQTGVADDQTPILRELNQGHNESAIDPVGLTFYATAGVNYYFELGPNPSAESDWYKLTLKKLDDYGATCSGAAMLNIASVNLSNGSLSSTITSQLTQDDKDCFHIKPATVGGCYTLVLPQSPDSISPLVELFSYNPNAFNFSNDGRIWLGQSTFTSGNGQNDEYTIGFRRTPDSCPPEQNPSIPGLNYKFPGFTPNVGYCACISDGVPDGDNGQQDGSGQNGSSGDTNTNVTCCDGGTLMDRDNISNGKIEIPGNQDYFKVSLEAGLQHRVSLHADCDMPLRLEVIENGVVVASGDTSNSLTCRVYVDFTPNGSTICLRVSAMDSSASSDETYSLQISLNAK
jgi:hypothetical protein